MLLDIEQIVAAKVHDQITAMNGKLDVLVRNAVDRELDRLVADLLEAELEGSVEDIGHTRDRRDAHHESKTCSRCTRHLDVKKFEKGRNVCRECRRADARRGSVHQAVQQQEATGPFDGSQSPSSPPASNAAPSS